jgi:hypothetical protein
LYLAPVDWRYRVRRLQSAVFDIDGEIGTEQGAQSTVNATGIVCQFGWMIAFGVGVLRHDQHILGAEFNAKAASFAPFLDDMDDTVGHLDAVPVQGLSPIRHSPSSIPR